MRARAHYGSWWGTIYHSFKEKIKHQMITEKNERLIISDPFLRIASSSRSCPILQARILEGNIWAQPMKTFVSALILVICPNAWMEKFNLHSGVKIFLLIVMFYLTAPFLSPRHVNDFFLFFFFFFFLPDK